MNSVMPSTGVRRLLAAAPTALKSAARVQARSFSALPRLRPTTAATASSVFRPFGLLPTTSATTATTATTTTADLVPTEAISRHPALAGLASQIRCGPRPTMERSSRLVQKRRHGFLSRVRSKNGRKTLARRRAKGRKRLSH